MKIDREIQTQIKSCSCRYLLSQGVGGSGEEENFFLINFKFINFWQLIQSTDAR